MIIKNAIRSRWRNKKLAFVSAIFLLCSVIFFCSLVLYKEYSLANTTPLTTYQPIQFIESANGADIEATFTANSNNLGIVALKTLRVNDPKSTLSVVISSDNWKFTNNYNPYLFTEHQVYNFGTPLIKDSKGQIISIKMSSTGNNIRDILAYSDVNFPPVIKYVFSIDSLFTSPTTTLDFLKNKILSLCDLLTMREIAICFIVALIATLPFIIDKKFQLSYSMLVSKPKFKQFSMLASLIIAISIISFQLKPVLDSGYYFDDLTNSQISGILHFERQNIWQYTVSRFITLTNNLGRIHPGLYLYYYFYVFNTLSAYKISIVILNIIVVMLFSHYLFSLFNSRKIGILSLLLIPLSFQMREYHDAITSYNGLLQIILILLFFSLQLYVWYRKKMQLRFYVGSVVAYTVCFMNFYEFAYLLYPAVLITDYNYSKSIRKSILATYPFGLISSVFIFLSFIVPHITKSSYEGIVINLNLELIALTYSKQLIASFPLTSIFAQNFLIQPFQPIELGMSLLFFLACFFTILKLDSNYQKIQIMTYLGLVFLCIPALPISLSSRYQSELIWGQGYLPVYAQYFGATLLLMSLVILVIRYFKNKTQLITVSFIVSLILSCTFLLTYQHNVFMVGKINTYWKYPMELIRKSIRAGILDEITSDQVIITETPGPWVSKNFFFTVRNKEYNIFEIDSQAGKLAPSHSSTHYFQYQPFGSKNGLVVLGEIQTVLMNEKNTRQIYCSKNIKLYVLNEDSSKKYITYHLCPQNNQSEPNAVTYLASPGISFIPLQDKQSFDMSSVYLHD